MSHSIISLGLGLGGGKSATSSGGAGGGGGGFAYELGDIDGVTYGLTVVPDLHLDPAQNAYNTGTTDATNGQTVATWADRSGNGNDFAEGTNKPTWKESWINGNPAIEFDGANDLLSDSDFFSSVDFTAKNATMIIAFQPDADGSYGLTATGSYANNDRIYSSGNLYSSAFMGTRINGGNFLEKYPPTRSAAVYGLRINNDAATYKLYYNFREHFDNTAYDVAHFGVGFGGDNMTIGCGDTTYKFDGKMGDVLVFNSALSDEDFEAVHSYLDAKYKLNKYAAKAAETAYTLGTVGVTAYTTTETPVGHFSAQSNTLASDGSAATDTESIALWTDKARGYHAVQPDGNFQPVLATNQINSSLSGIYFDGTDDKLAFWMASMLGDFAGLDGSVICLFQPDSDTAFEVVGVGGANNARITTSATSYWGQMRQSRLTADVTNAWASTGAQMLSVVSDASGNTYKVYKNGGADNFTSGRTASAAVQMFNSTTKDPSNFGATTGTAAYNLKGWIYEILIFDHPVSTANHDKVLDYFTALYDVAHSNIS